MIFSTGPARDDTAASRSIAHVTGLVPNEAYNFASAGFGNGGDIIAPLSGTCDAIVAATPLPLALLWAQLAVEAGRAGEMGIARRAAAVVARVWVSFGPLRPPHARSSFGTLVLRQTEVSRVIQ